MDFDELIKKVKEADENHNRLQEQLNQLSNQNQQVDKRITEINQKISNLQKELAEQQQKKVDMNNKAKEIQQQQDRADENRQRLQADLDKAKQQRSSDLGAWLLKQYPDFGEMQMSDIQQIIRRNLAEEEKKKVQHSVVKKEKTNDAEAEEGISLADNERIYSTLQNNNPIDTVGEALNAKNLESPYGNQDISKEMNDFVHQMKVSGKDIKGHPIEQKEKHHESVMINQGIEI